MQTAKDLLPSKLLVIVAHPDDEGYLVAGTTWLNHQAGGTTTIVCATLGEKGSSHIRYPVSPAKLKILRKKEMMAAAKYTKVDRLDFLELPDGGVAGKISTFLVQTERILKKVRPNVIISFGPDGVTGHRDHQACYRVAQSLAKLYQLPLYVATAPPTLATKLQGWLLSRRAFGTYAKLQPFQPASVQIRLPRGFKQRVLRHYRSQVDPQRPYGEAPAGAVKALLATEYFSQMR